MISDYSGATDFYQRAANFARNYYTSKHHPRLATCFAYLAQVQLKLNNWAEAAGYIEESLYMRLKHLPEDHPDVAYSEHAKGSLMTVLGKYSDAQVYIERSLVTRRVVLGARHPDVAESLASLGRVEIGLGRPKEAKEHMVMSMDIYREALGQLESDDSDEPSIMAQGENALQPHPVIADVTLQLGLVYLDVGSPLTGLVLIEKGRDALETVFATLGEIVNDGEGGNATLYNNTENHPDRSMALLHVARGNLEMGYYDEAIRECKQAGRALTTIYGQDCTAVARAIWLLADINSAKGLSRLALVQYSHATSDFHP